MKIWDVLLLELTTKKESLVIRLFYFVRNDVKLAQYWAWLNGGAQLLKLKAMRGVKTNRGAKGEKNETKPITNEFTNVC